MLKGAAVATIIKRMGNSTGVRWVITNSPFSTNPDSW
jgi:hypothetical protein